MNTNQQDRDDVIVVDPNRDDYAALLLEWQRDGLRCNQFVVGEDALKRARPAPRALWLVSTRLPDISSVDLLAILRRKGCRATFFLIGDGYSPADEFAARLAGASAYVCKPATREWLDALHPRCRSPATSAGTTTYIPGVCP
jgi:DNA-binding response OmpR family regulator